MDEDLATRLLASIEVNRLVILSGAGLSMSPPSLVPSANALANQVSDEYQRVTGSGNLTPVRNDIEAIARYFLARMEIVPVLIRRLISWTPFRGRFNDGHAAIADFLGARIAECAVTTNIDELTEIAARELGESDFRSALNGQEASQGGQAHAPYLKVHGCVKRDMDNTLWCHEQLGGGTIATRVADSRAWLMGNLRQRDLVVVGFWSDWSYLNEVLENCLSPEAPNAVILVDPASAATLSQKAPLLWAWAHRGWFQHVQEDGKGFLAELRRRFSLNFFRRLIEQAAGTYQGLRGTLYTGPVNFHASAVTDDLFAIRRDVEGVPAGAMPRAKRPDPTMNLVAATWMLLIEDGAALTGACFQLAAQRIRVVRGAGDVLSLVKKKFEREEGTPEPIDIVIAAGAEEDGNAPSDLVRDAEPATIARPRVAGRWMTLREARGFLGL